MRVARIFVNTSIMNVEVPKSPPQHGSPNTGREMSVSRDRDQFKRKCLKILIWGGALSPQWLSHIKPTQ